MQSNDLMNKKLREVKNTNIKLNSELAKILDSGLISVDGCIFLKYLYERKGNATAEYFQDKTGYEAFVNSFHTGDYCGGDLLSQSLLFIKNLFQLYKSKSPANCISAIISIDEGDCIIKFHTNRDGEEYISGDLNEFSQPILILASRE